MSVTFTETTVVDPTAVRIKFTSDASTPVTFRVFVMGLLATTFVSSDGYGQFDLAVGEGEQPYVQVIDDDVSREDYAFPGSMTLAWQAKAGAVSYRVDEWVASEWIERETVADRGEGAFVHLTHWLDDATTYQWRVVPIDSTGNDGTALEFEFTFVRHPDVPDVTYPVDASGNLVVTAAA